MAKMANLPRLRSISLIMIACLTMLCLQGWIEWRARATQVGQTRAALLNLATALSQHADDTIEIADRVLAGITRQMEVNGTGPQGLEKLQQYLTVQKSALVRVRDMTVTDSEGNWLATTTSATGISSRDRDFFRRQRDDPGLGLYISMPLRSVINGRWIIAVSRRYPSADGGFGGIVSAVIDLSYFSDYYGRYDLGSNSAVALAMSSGELLARYPSLDNLVGQVARSQLFLPGAHADSGSMEETSSYDGVRRFVGYHRSRRYPLLVVASMSRAQALAGWRVEALWHIAIALVLTAGIGLLFIDLTHQATRSRLAELRLGESEARYRLMADHASDIVTRVGADGQRTYVSQAAQRIIGVEPDALLGKKLLDFVHPDDRAALQARVLGLIDGISEDRQPIFRMIRPDGGEVWIEAASTIMFDPGTGEPDGYVSVLRDITKRVAAESAMRESEDRYRLLLQSGGVTEAVYMLDPSGLIESWNSAAEKIKGYAPDEIIGRSFATFFTPEDLVKNEPARLLAAARENGQVVAEGWRVRKDGSRFLAHVTLEAIYREDGTVRAFSKVTHDITIQRIQEEQRAIIIEAAPTGMIIIDEAGIITLANAQAERLFDFPPGTLKDQRVDRLIPDILDPANFDDTAKATPGWQSSGRRSDGSAVPLEVMMRQVETPRGEIIVASVTDITERLRQAAEERAAEARLRQEMEVTNENLTRLSRHLAKARDRANLASEAKSRFLAGMSHELRTPLNGILGYAQLLQMEGGLNTAQGARLEAMLQAGRHLLQMITGVLDLSEIEAEHVALRAVELNLHAMAEVCLNVVRPDAEAKDLALRIAFDPAAERKVVTDPNRLRQILVNLLGNAVKFTSEGSIELRLCRGQTADTVRIEVADTGTGIPPDKQDRLFQAFERLDIEATRTIEGAGLGLALSARLANLMGARLGHQNNPGGGSVFWLELPLAPPAGLSAAAQQAQPDPATWEPASPVAAAVPVPRRCLDVLVVDDVPMNCEVASAYLRSGDHRTTSVATGAAAVAASAAHDFDVILMDVRMPGIDGLEATRRIRALGGPRGRVPVVALTAQVFTAQIEACRLAGMDGHIAKPFDRETLLAAVEKAVADGHVPYAGAATADAVPPIPEAGADKPVVNADIFEKARNALTADIAGQFLMSMKQTGETLLRDLRQADSLGRDNAALAETVHRLAGSASIFGLERLTVFSQQFEHAVLADPAKAQPSVDRFIAALEETLAEIKIRLALSGSVLI